MRFVRLEGQSDLENSPVNACGAILELIPVLSIPLPGAGSAAGCGLNVEIRRRTLFQLQKIGHWPQVELGGFLKFVSFLVVPGKILPMSLQKSLVRKVTGLVVEMPIGGNVQAKIQPLALCGLG